MSRVRTVIVDDEYESRQTLNNFLVKYCPGVAVVAEAGSVAEAVTVIGQSSPELVFLDINMPAENGFQLFSKLTDIHFSTVFITAYDEYALQAFRNHALDYLLKPVDIHELIKTVDRVLSIEEDKQKIKQLSSILEFSKRPLENSKIALSTTDGLIYVKTMQIVRCEAKDNYTHIYFSDGKKLVIPRTLAVYEEALKDKGFARVHHQHLINLQHVEKYVRGRGGIVIMADGKEIQVAQRKKEEFLRLLEAKG